MSLNVATIEIQDIELVSDTEAEVSFVSDETAPFVFIPVNAFLFILVYSLVELIRWALERQRFLNAARHPSNSYILRKGHNRHRRA